MKKSAIPMLLASGLILQFAIPAGQDATSPPHKKQSSKMKSESKKSFSAQRGWYNPGFDSGLSGNNDSESWDQTYGYVGDEMAGASRRGLSTRLYDEQWYSGEWKNEIFRHGRMEREGSESSNIEYRGPAEEILNSPDWVGIGYDLDGDGVYEAREMLRMRNIEEARRSSQKVGTEEVSTDRRAEIGALGPVQPSAGDQAQIEAGVTEHEKTAVPTGEDEKRARAVEYRAPSETIASSPDWVFVGFDLDRDGEFDTREKVLVDDIERARVATQAFADESGVDYDLNRELQLVHAKPELREIKGKITEIKTTNIAGHAAHRLARIETESGDVAVIDLGPREKATVEFSADAPLTARVAPGYINDLPVLIAHEVEYDGQRHAVETPQRGLVRIRGEVVNLVYTSAEPDKAATVAEIRLSDQLENQTVKVNLGSPDRAKEAGLNEGDELRALVSTGNQADAMLEAREIHSHGKTIRINEERR